jgi:hypothetical protein
MSSVDEVQERLEKLNLGKFYTVNSEYILQGLRRPEDPIIEPFAGNGDLLDWIGKERKVEAYDLEPQKDGITKRDTLLNPPIYKDKWVVTNPPYRARNKTSDKTVFDKYKSNDLYKCFLLSLCQDNCLGGILIIPVGFFLSPRPVDLEVRNSFLEKYRIGRVNYFEEKVFPDTSTTVVAFSFTASPEKLTCQDITFHRYPAGDRRVFSLSKENNWIIGGEIYRLPSREGFKIGRFVSGKKLKHDQTQTFLTLTAMDTGKNEGRIKLEYKEGYIYPAKDTSRSYATLILKGFDFDSSLEEKILARKFNRFIEEKREETWSLFLPQYRESKEYARKRIPFELAYQIILYLVDQL